MANHSSHIKNLMKLNWHSHMNSGGARPGFQGNGDLVSHVYGSAIRTSPVVQNVHAGTASLQKRCRAQASGLVQEYSSCV